MATFNIHCQDPWFSFIRQGIKPVEGRKNIKIYSEITAGDTINFSNGKETFSAIVTEVRSYVSIEQYLFDVTVEKALPGINTVDEALKIYYQWSTQEQIRKYGFLGIFITPLL